MAGTTRALYANAVQAKKCGLRMAFQADMKAMEANK